MLMAFIVDYFNAARRILHNSKYLQCAKKGVIDRGILLDYHTRRLKQILPYNAFQSGSMPLEYLKAVAEAQDTQIRFGDFLCSAAVLRDRAK